MWNAEVVSGWQGDGVTERFRPVLAALLTLPGESTEDTTGTPSVNLTPDPNCYVVRVRCEPATLDQIEADGRFLCIWCELEPEDAI